MTSSPYAIWTSLLLISVVALIPILYLMRRRLGGWPGQRAQDMAIVETLAVGPRERLMVVTVAGETLLLGVTGQQIQLLKAIEPCQAPASTANSFASRLDSALEPAGELR